MLPRAIRGERKRSKTKECRGEKYSWCIGHRVHCRELEIINIIAVVTKGQMCRPGIDRSVFSLTLYKWKKIGFF